MRTFLICLSLGVLGLLPLSTFAAQPTSSAQATLLQDQVSIVKAQVTKIISHETKNIPGTDVQSLYQTLQATILEGTQKDQSVTVDNDYLQLKEGDLFYLMITVRADDGSVVYAVKDAYRLPAIYFYLALFVVVVLIFGGFQGLRGLISLAASFGLILYVLLPGIIHGYNPIVVSVGVASLIIILGSYVTHGFTKTTSAAVVGMIVTIALTGTLAYFAVHGTQLSGYNTEEAVYLNFDTGGSINFVGLLLGGILIGLLGVLYDAAISQAMSVEELHHVAPHLSRRIIFERALRLGREHIGALVNTLAIAYVGASLPLLLLFYISTSGFAQTINQELFATEIIRTLIGSIGLVLAVPITTLLAVLMLVKPKQSNSATLEKEMHELEHMGHHH